MISSKKIMTYYMLLSLLIFSGGHTVTIVGAESCAPDIMWALSAREGRRMDLRHLTKEQNFMEDRHTVKSQGGLHFFGVYDGHGGSGAAEYVQDHLAENFFKAQGETVGERLDHAFSKTDEDFLGDPKFREDESGTTGLVAVIDANGNGCIAHAGDSRAILARNKDEIWFATEDHKPNLQEERERIEKAGGYVRARHFHCYRVNDCLAVSRAIGDRGLKKSGVIPDPDIYDFYEKDIQNDDFLVLACDGLWDVMTNEEVAAFVHEQFNKNEIDEEGLTEEEIQKRVVEYGEEVKFSEGNNGRAKLIADSLVDKAYEKGSGDNISVLIVKIGGLLRAEADKLRQGVKLERGVVMPIKNQKKSSSWTTRLSKLIGYKKGIILSLGVVAIFYSLYHYRFL